MEKKFADTYAGKTILITGGRGYVGSALTTAFAKIACRIRLLDTASPGVWHPAESRAQITVLQGSVADPKIWEVALPGVDYVFHLADSGDRRTDDDIVRDLHVNALSVLYLLEVCRARELRPTIVFPSSTSLFGNQRQMIVDETMREDPFLVWSVHKLTAENYLHVYKRRYGIASMVLRLTNVYGPTARFETRGRVIVNEVIQKALDGGPLSLFANRGATRDFIYIDDVVAAFLHAGRKKQQLSDRRFYVIGSGQGVSFETVWHLIAEMTGRIVNKKIRLDYDNSKAAASFDLRCFVADSTRFRTITGWSPTVTLKEGLRRTIRDVRASIL